MSIMMKTTLAAAVLAVLAPSVQARDGGARAHRPNYGWSAEQQRAYRTDIPAWQYGDDAWIARAQRPGRATIPYNWVFRDDPPGAAFQDWGNREDMGY